MKLVEHTLKYGENSGEIFINENEKIHTFAVDGDTVFIYGQTSDIETDKPPTRYVLLHTGDEVPEGFHHITTFVEDVTQPLHLFLDENSMKKKEMAKVITDRGTRTVIDGEEVKQ